MHPVGDAPGIVLLSFNFFFKPSSGNNNKGRGFQPCTSQLNCPYCIMTKMLHYSQKNGQKLNYSFVSRHEWLIKFYFCLGLVWSRDHQLETCEWFAKTLFCPFKGPNNSSIQTGWTKSSRNPPHQELPQQNTRNTASHSVIQAHRWAARPTLMLQITRWELFHHT